MTVVCEPLEFASASEAALCTYRDISSVAERLLGDLSGLAGMAGSDGAGQEFATTYDDAAAQVFVALSNLSMGAGQLADLLHATGFNHANADDPALAPGVQPLDYPPTPGMSSTPQKAVSVPPSANGGSGDQPWGWDLVSRFVGYLWPNGDESQLCAAEAAWGMAASGLETAAMSVSESIRMVQAQQSPEVPSVVSNCEDYRQQVLDVAACCRDLGRACGDYATHLKEAHEEILDMLEQFLWETAAIATAGAVGSFFSFGVAGAAGGSAVAARAAIYGARIARVVEKLIAATGIVGRTIAAASTRIAEIASRVSAAVASRGRVLADKVPALGKAGKIPLRSQLDDASVWKGKFPNDGGPPNGFLVRRDEQGNVTHYIQYDENGRGIKRVDITGASHAGVPTPHVVDIVHDVNPKTGLSVPRELKRSVRPAEPGEIP